MVFPPRFTRDSKRHEQIRDLFDLQTLYGLWAVQAGTRLGFSKSNQWRDRKGGPLHETMAASPTQTSQTFALSDVEHSVKFAVYLFSESVVDRATCQG